MNLGIGIAIGAGAKNRLIVSDKFNRADSATSLGAADTGQAWTNNAGTLGIIGSKAYMPNAGTSIATVPTPVSNCALSFVDSGIQEVSLFNGVVARFTDTSNYIRIVLQTTTLYVQRRQAGTTTVIATNTIARADGDVYRVVLNGSSITVYRNGEVVLTVTETHNQAATSHGLILSTTLARMDNFKVEAI